MSKLYVIPTPIGNLEDMTFRAVRMMNEVSLILAEDTRQTAKLLKHYDIKTPQQAHHKFNEHQQVEEIAERIKAGEAIALVSDAGTPAISDPGYLLVRTCIEQGVPVETLPGATALIPALVNSGLPNDRFCFEGFLPHKKGRQTRLNALKTETRTMVFYESPYRLLKTLEQLADVLGADRQAAISRELSKLHEENINGILQVLIENFRDKTPKGEFVIIVSGLAKKKKSDTQADN